MSSGPAKTPTVSVVIPCFKQARFLAESVGSLIEQTYRDWECVIVDDGSPDDTAQTAQALIAMHPDRQIRLVRQANQGVGAARNNGIRAASGRYVMPLDADDLLSPTMLEKTAAVLDADAKIAIAYTDMKSFGVRAGLWRTGPFILDAGVRNNPLPYCALMRREVWEAVGGYESRQRTFYEDWDFWLHALRRGFRGERIPEALFLYRTSDNGRIIELDSQRPKLIASLVTSHAGLFGPAREEAAREQSGAKSLPESRQPIAPAISVIVTAKANLAGLEIALRSVLAQSFRDFEVIVVDDHSLGGGSIDALIRRCDAGEKIVSVRLSRGRGKARARNAGLAVARGRYIAWLDEQDRWLPGHLEALIGAIDDGKHQVAYADARKSSEKPAGKSRLTVHEFFSSGKPDLDRWIQGVGIPLSCMLHERASLGIGFDETLGALEDWELLLRLSAKSFVHVPRATCVLGGGFVSDLEPVRRVSGNLIRNRHRAMIDARPRARASRYRARMSEVTRLLELGKPQAALEEMARVVLADPTWAEAYNDLAVLEYSNGRLADAEWAVERSLSLDPASSTAKETQAAIKAARARAPQTEAGSKLSASRVSYASVLPAIEKHVAENEAAKAIALLEVFVAAQPDCAEALNDLAAVLHGAGRSQDALAHALRAAFLEPRSPVITSTLAVIQLASGGLESAARTILPLLNLHPDDPNLLAVANEIGRRAEEDSKARVEQLHRAPAKPKAETLAIVFSKDRPLQLDATLRSLQMHWQEADRADLKVLAKGSTEEMRGLYRQLAGEHPGVELIAETDFRGQLLALLGGYERVLFLVDDNLFVKSFSLARAEQALDAEPQLLGVSLRLGKNTSYSYAMSAAQRVPLMTPAHGMNRFRWIGAEHDFGYPLEVSSSLYRAAEMSRLLAQLPFRNPNELEAMMAQRAPPLAGTQPELLCFETSVTFCNPVNMVQTTFTQNRAGHAAELSAQSLAQRYAEGARVRIESYRGFVPKGCHQEVPLELEQKRSELRSA